MGSEDNRIRKTPIISIITTFYNAQDFIINAINSVWQQSINLHSDVKIEYVIVDDKSQDNSREIVEKFIASKIPQEKFIWKLVEPEKNLGCGGARKFGIDNATGDYFMFLDADDYYIRTDFVNRAYVEMVKTGADVIEYGIIYNNHDGSKINSVAPHAMEITDVHDIEMALFKDNLIKFNVWSKIYKRSIVESYPYSTVRTFEDVRTIPVWMSNCKKVIIQPTCEVNYRAAGDSIIRKNWVDTRLGTIEAIVGLFPWFKDDPILLRAMYGRAMIDLEALLNNHSSENEGFNQMSRYNTEMLKYIYPDTWRELVYHDDGYLDEDETIDSKEYLKEDLNTLPGMI